MGGSNVITRALQEEDKSVKVIEDVTTEAEVREGKETNTCTYMHIYAHTGGRRDVTLLALKMKKGAMSQGKQVTS